jgi:hypothetical protein
MFRTKRVRPLNSHLNNNKIFYSNLDKSLNEIDLKRLNSSQIEIIRIVYKTFLNQNLTNLVDQNCLVNTPKRRKLRKRKATLASSENSSTSTQNSLGGFKESFDSLKVNKYSSTEIISSNLDSFSSIFKMNDNNRKLFLNKKHKISNNELEKIYSLDISPIQADIMPKWSTINQEEKDGILELFSRWQTSLDGNFNRTKNKQISNLTLNYENLIKSGSFNFDKNLISLKRNQLEIFDLSTIETTNGKKIKPNTRLILRGFMQFINALEYLKEARQNVLDSDVINNLYWRLINKFLNSFSKAIFRCLFYVHENANLYKASIGLPPIFFLESDELDNKEIPTIKLESLIEYAYLCLNRQNKNLKIQDNDTKNNENNNELSFVSNDSFKLKKYKLILKCLIRLIQVGLLIRDTLITKQVRFEKNSNTNQVIDVDVYAHFISNNVCLIREYLVEILKH